MPGTGHIIAPHTLVSPSIQGLFMLPGWLRAFVEQVFHGHSSDSRHLHVAEETVLIVEESHGKASKDLHRKTQKHYITLSSLKKDTENSRPEQLIHLRHVRTTTSIYFAFQAGFECLDFQELEKCILQRWE